MTPSLVGTIGTVASGTGTVNPSWGSGESRTAGNLLLCWAVASGSGLFTPSGWSYGPSGGTSALSIAVFYKIAAGADTAPTVSVTSTPIFAQLAEFSGLASSSPLDQNGFSGVGVTSPTYANGGGPTPDQAAGELVVYVGGAAYGTSVTLSLSVSLNNGATATNTTNTTGSNPLGYCFGYGVTTGNSSADQLAFTFGTGSVSGGACGVGSFLLGASAATASSFSVSDPTLSRIPGIH